MSLARGFASTRVVQIAVLLSLWAGAAQAETWRILHWDKFGLIAVDAEHRRTTGLSNPALPVLELKLYPGASKVEAELGEQEVNCGAPRVRTRTRQQFLGDLQTATDTEIQRWRDPGEERDRLLVWAVCNPRNLDAVPRVTASLEEAMRAHLDAATAPKALAATPAWSAAWNRLAPGRGPDALTSIAAAVRVRHPFVVASVTTDGGAILLATDIENIGDMRYRFHAARVGAPQQPDIAAIWVLQEADCSQRRLRYLGWAGFDAELHKKFGEDTNTINTPFQPPAPGTTDVIVLEDVCGASRIIPKMTVVTAHLADAVAASRWILEGDTAAAKGLHDAAGWRAAFAACGCKPADNSAPGGSPGPSSPRTRTGESPHH
jgi:hypothetical protein